MKNPADLYCQYQGQRQPQPAFVYLDENGAVSADIGHSTPADVWHGQSIRWAINPRVNTDRLYRILSDENELTQLFATVHAGHTVAHDGCNWVGALTPAAVSAAENIARMLAEWDELVDIQDPAEYFGDMPPIDAPAEDIQAHAWVHYDVWLPTADLRRYLANNATAF